MKGNAMGADVRPETGHASRIDSRAQQLVAVAARLTRLHGKVLGDLEIPLTFRQYRTLSRVLGGATSLSQLAAFGNLTIPTVSEGVDVLVRRGLLETRPSVVDRRAITLHVTERGVAALAAGDLALQDVSRALTQDLTQEQSETLTQMLASVYSAATAYFQRL